MRTHLALVFQEDARYEFLHMMMTTTSMSTGEDSAGGGRIAVPWAEECS
jgi:hypothetical protein